MYWKHAWSAWKGKRTSDGAAKRHEYASIKVGGRRTAQDWISEQYENKINRKRLRRIQEAMRLLGQMAEDGKTLEELEGNLAASLLKNRELLQTDIEGPSQGGEEVEQIPLIWNDWREEIARMHREEGVKELNDVELSLLQAMARQLKLDGGRLDIEAALGQSLRMDIDAKVKETLFK